MQGAKTQTKAAGSQFDPMVGLKVGLKVDPMIGLKVGLMVALKVDQGVVLVAGQGHQVWWVLWERKLGVPGWKGCP